MKSDVATVLELEARRCRLLERGNIEAVDALLDADLIYAHATGVIHDRAQWLEFLRTGTRFKAVKRQDLRASEYGQIVVVTGLMQIQGERIRTGETFQSTSFVSQVWRRADDDAWRLRLLQSTRVDDGMWH